MSRFVIMVVAALVATGSVYPAATLADTTLTIHYHRFDNSYAGWGLHCWGAVVESGGSFQINGQTYSWQNPLPWTGTSDYGVYWEVPIAYPQEDLGFIIHLGDVKDPGPDMFWGDYAQHPEIWILSGFTQIFTSEPDPDIRLLAAVSDGAQTLNLRLAQDAGQLEGFTVWRGETEVAVTSRTATTPRHVVLTLAAPVVISQLYTVRDAVGGNEVVVRHDFDDAAWAYAGDDLGCTFTPAGTTFKLWSPVASAATVRLYDSPYPVDGETFDEYPLNPVAGQPGVRGVTVPGNHKDRYYLYNMTVYGQTYLTPDLYSVALSSNSQRSQIIDLAETDPPGWQDDVWPDFDIAESVIYELHIRDMTADPNWNGSEVNRHKFLGVVQPGTSHEGRPTGFDHLLDLGVNTVQILPMYDFTSVDENNPQSRNWGYDPYAYNVPEGSYASEADDGKVRIREMKQMIQGFHAAGIKVVMDVVYNHTHNVGPQGSLFDAMVPKYYYRLLADGSYANGSGVGNEVATEKLMARRFILQSCLYWVQEYRVDGFRFDLMGLIDTELMAEITAAVKAINPHAIIYGEPWGGYGTQPLTGKGDQRGLGFGCFNDNIRNAIRGSTDGTDPGYAMGNVNTRAAVVRGIAGSIDDFTDGPDETINYISAHDNYTWWDKLDHRWNPTNPPPGHSQATLERMARFGLSMVMTAQGIPFLHAGSEFLRTKRTGDPGQSEEAIRNSYNQGDDVNQLDWERRVEHDEVVAYVRGLVALRLARPELRLPTADLIRAHLHPLPDMPQNAIGYRLDDVTPDDGWGDLLVFHNPGAAAIEVPLPAGQWAVVVDAERAGTEPLATYVSPLNLPALVAVPGRSSLVLYQQEAPALQLNLFQNQALDRYLHLAVNARQDVGEVSLRINDEPVALVEQAAGSWLASYRFAASGRLVIVLEGGGQTLRREVAAWALAPGAVAGSVDGRLELAARGDAGGDAWLVLIGPEGRPDLPADTWLVGPEGGRLTAAATLRVHPSGDGQVIEQRQDGHWQPLATTRLADGRLEAATDRLGAVRLAPGVAVPPASRLLGNAPNPFNPTTEIRFELAAADAAAPVALRVLDARGRLVRTLMSGTLGAGAHAVTWDGRDPAGRLAASGVYFYRLETRRQAHTGRMLLVK